MSKILLHNCCAPCTTFVYKWLKENDLEVKGLFYNPNIAPPAEYEKRLSAMELYASNAGMDVIYKRDDSQITPGDCENCYRIRLRKTAELAKDGCYAYFSTTLLISPYQKHDLLKEIGEEVSSEIGIDFYYQDFRVGYQESRQMAKEMNLYRQKYCGCGVELSGGGGNCRGVQRSCL